MTPDDYRLLFKGKDLIVGDNYYRFDGKGNYLLSKGDDSVNGTYDFKEINGRVFFISKPPIYPEIGEKVEALLYLGGHQVLFENK